MIQEHRRELITRVQNREDERCRPIRIGRMEIGAANDEHLGTLDVPRSNREHQRRHPCRGPNTNVGAAIEQEPDDIRMFLGGGPHQRCLIPQTLGRVYVRSLVQQHRHGIHTSRTRRHHQDRLTVVGIRRLGIRARLEQAVDDRCVAIAGGQPERRDAEPRCCVDVGAGAKHTGNGLDVFTIDGGVKRVGAVRRDPLGSGARLPAGHDRVRTP